MDSSVSGKDEIWFLRVCHHVPHELHLQTNTVKVCHANFNHYVIKINENIPYNLSHEQVIRILTYYSAMQLSGRSVCFCPKAVYKPVWHITLLSVQWINCWWRTGELPETCRVSWQNKFVNLVDLVGFITKKFVTMHGHMNVTNLLRCTVTWT